MTDKATIAGRSKASGATDCSTAGLRVLDLFSGIGGFSLGFERTGRFRTIAFCEIEKFPRKILKKHWPDVPIFEDVRELYAEDISETVDVITAGFPCQPASIAGKRRGTKDDRWLWPEIIRLLRELSPAWGIFENVPGLLSLDGGVVFEQVCLDLEGEGYEIQSFIIPACAVNAPHRRDRVWIVAHSNSSGQQRERELPESAREKGIIYNRKATADTNGNGSYKKKRDVAKQKGNRAQNWIPFGNFRYIEEAIEREFRGTHDGFSKRLDKNMKLRRINKHDMMGYKSKQPRSNYASEEKGRPGKVLRILRQEIEKKKIQWEAGGQDKILKKEILRQALHGKNVDKGRENKESVSSDSKEICEAFMRSLRYVKKTPGASCRWGLQEQFPEELKDFVFLLSLEMALETWAAHAEATVGMQNLWRASEVLGIMPKTLSEVQEIWRSSSYEEKKWTVLCAGTGSEFVDCFPGVYPVSNDGLSDRVARLKALGNAVVPQITEMIGRAIMMAESIKQ